MANNIFILKNYNTSYNTVIIAEYERDLECQLILLLIIAMVTMGTYVIVIAVWRGGGCGGSRGVFRWVESSHCLRVS
jgi:hypothetical protein